MKLQEEKIYQQHTDNSSHFLHNTMPKNSAAKQIMSDSIVWHLLHVGGNKQHSIRVIINIVNQFEKKLS